MRVVRFGDSVLVLLFDILLLAAVVAVAVLGGRVVLRAWNQRPLGVRRTGSVEWLDLPAARYAFASNGAATSAASTPRWFAARVRVVDGMFIIAEDGREAFVAPVESLRFDVVSTPRPQVVLDPSGAEWHYAAPAQPVRVIVDRVSPVSIVAGDLSLARQSAALHALLRMISPNRMLDVVEPDPDAVQPSVNDGDAAASLGASGSRDHVEEPLDDADVLGALDDVEEPDPVE